MKRDMELIRGMLLQLEGEEPKPELTKWTEEQKAYHAALLVEAGLANGSAIENYYQKERRAVELHRLTWVGHEFLDAARDDTRWKKALGIIAKAGGSVTLPILKQMLTGFLKEKLGVEANLSE
jgi:hypothetical protein